MPGYNPPEFSGAGLKYHYANTDYSQVITSAATGTTKTAFAHLTEARIPEASGAIGGLAVIRASGTFGSGVVSLSQTVSIEMAGVEVASVTFTPALNIANRDWFMDIRATILSNLTIEVRGEAQFNATPISINNAAAFTMSLVGGVPVVVYNKYGGIAVGGSIQQRQLIVQVF